MIETFPTILLISSLFTRERVKGLFEYLFKTVPRFVSFLGSSALLVEQVNYKYYNNLCLA